MKKCWQNIWKVIVEEIVEKKYHILKTNDNFYLYKNDIKRCLREMREDIPWMEQVQKKADKEKRRRCAKHHQCDRTWI